jgi:hypothetical protein
MNGCRESRHVQDWLEGQLSPERARAFAAHLERCPLCIAERDAFEGLFAMLGDDRLPIEDPGPALTERILDRVLPSRLRRRRVSIFGWAYGTAWAASTFAFASWAMQPSTPVWLTQRFSEASVKMLQSLLLAFQVLTRSWLGLLDGCAWLAGLSARVAPIGRALTRPLMDPLVAAVMVAAVIACAGFLWWMRPREDSEEIRNVSLLWL